MLWVKITEENDRLWHHHYTSVQNNVLPLGEKSTVFYGAGEAVPDIVFIKCCV